MRERYGIELESLKQLLLELAAMSENAVVRALRAVSEQNADEARKVIDGDRLIDEMEVRIEEECLKLMALYQPVAGDLRMLVTVLKVNGELERSADLAGVIAARAVNMAHSSVPTENRFEFSDMATRVHRMLKDALDALVYRDAAVARDVMRADDAVDGMNAANYVQARACIAEKPELTEYVLDCLAVSQALERIADIATNICEDVIYLEEGKIVRHLKRL